MKRTVFAGILLFSMAYQPMHAQTTGKGYRFANTAPARVDLPKGGATVPLLLLGQGAGTLPVVEIMINGHGPFRFGVETGAQFAGLRPGLADSLHLASAATIYDLPAYRTDSVSIGGAVFRNLPMATLQTAARDIDGILGFPTFHDVLLTVDYPGKQLRIERGALPAPNGRDILPITTINDGDFLGVPVTIAGQPYDAVVDTRSTGAIQITPDAAAGMKFDGDLVVVGMARGAAIAPVEVKAGTLTGDAKLGAYTFTAPEVGVRPLPEGFPTNPLLGTIVLHNFVMTIDQKNGRIRFARDGSPIIELPRRLRGKS